MRYTASMWKTQIACSAPIWTEIGAILFDPNSGCLDLFPATPQADPRLAVVTRNGYATGNSARDQSELTNFFLDLGERRGDAKIANPSSKTFLRQFGGWRSGCNCLVFCGGWRLGCDRRKERIGAKYRILGDDENGIFSPIRA